MIKENPTLLHKAIKLNCTHKRTMFGRAIKVSNRIYNQNLHSRSYAVLKVTEKPKINEGDSNSYENNPVVKSKKYVRGKETIVYTRHPEISASLCSFPGCDKKVCAGFCAKPLEINPKSIAHVSHGTKGNTVVFHDKDLNNNFIPENIILYKKPHDTFSDVNEEKSKILQQEDRLPKLNKILKENREDDI